MASEIRVNQIQSRTGVSTVNFTDSGPIISGVTTVQGSLNVTDGITGDLTGNVTGNINASGGGSTFNSNVGIQTNDITRSDLRSRKLFCWTLYWRRFLGI